MNKFILIICLIFISINLSYADIEIPEKYIGQLYQWYKSEFTIPKAFKLYYQLYNGEDIELNGVRISTKGTGDINVYKNDLRISSFWIDDDEYYYECEYLDEPCKKIINPEPIPKYHVGAFRIYPIKTNDKGVIYAYEGYMSYLNKTVEDLLNNNQALIKNNNDGRLRIKIIPKE